MEGSVLKLKTNFREIEWKKPLWMAILNVTPDSFSDGGRTGIQESADHAMRLLAQGADILDIGGESSRPGADPVSPKEEIRRIGPVIREIRDRCAEEGLPKPFFSVDTYHPETAEFAVSLGVEMLNDIAGLSDPAMVRVARESGTSVCFMHMQGTPKTMQTAPHYENVLEDVFLWLARRRDALLEAGLEREKLVADFGLGFGKTMEQNWILAENARRFQDLGIPILAGHSRKRFLDRILDAHPEMSRDDATHAVSRLLVAQGVQILRTHVRPEIE